MLNHSESENRSLGKRAIINSTTINSVSNESSLILLRRRNKPKRNITKALKSDGTISTKRR
jgi:hypothetical protein